MQNQLILCSGKKNNPFPAESYSKTDVRKCKYIFVAQMVLEIYAKNSLIPSFESFCSAISAIFSRYLKQPIEIPYSSNEIFWAPYIINYREPQRVIVYSYTARCLGSQSAAALPCLTQRVEHFAVFQVLYWFTADLLLDYLYRRASPKLPTWSSSGSISLNPHA